MDSSPVSKGKKSPRGSPRKKLANKPKKRSLLERELETNLTDKITSPIMQIDGSPVSTSRYGRARKFKADMDFCNPEKLLQKMAKSPKREPIDVINSPVSPVYKMHASNSSVKESPKAITSVESPVKDQIESESSSSFKNDSPQKKKSPKIYVRTDLVQCSAKDSTGKMLRNMFSPKRNTHLNNILERSSGKHSLDSTDNSHIDNSSVVKTLDFDTGKAVKNVRSNVKPQAKDELDLEKMCLYQVGDLAWARVGAYPFWPCIVSRDPYSECFVKKKAIGRLDKPHVHVIFFGDNGRRGWIPDTMLRSYEGIDEFETFKEQLTPEDKKKDSKLYAAYFISEKKHTKWRVSVDEAEKLLKEPKDHRLDILNEMLLQNKGVKTTPKREKGIQLTRKSSDVSLSESLYDSLFSEDDTKTEELDNSRKKIKKQSLDVSDVVTACLDNMAAKTGITKIQKQSHMDRWLLKAKTHTPEKNVKSTTSKVKVRSVDNINNKTILPVENDVNKSLKKSNNKKRLRSCTKADKKKAQVPNDDIKHKDLENTSTIENVEHLALDSLKCDLEAIVPRNCNSEFPSVKKESDLEFNHDCCNIGNNTCDDNVITTDSAMEIDDVSCLDKSADEIDKANSGIESSKLTKTDANILSIEDNNRKINLEIRKDNEILTEQYKLNGKSLEVLNNNESLNTNLADSQINDVGLEVFSIGKKCNSEMNLTENNKPIENKEPENMNGHVDYQDDDVSVDTSINHVTLEIDKEIKSQIKVTENKELMENGVLGNRNGYVETQDDNKSVETSIDAFNLELGKKVKSQMENNEHMENRESEHKNVEFRDDDLSVNTSLMDTSENNDSIHVDESRNSDSELTHNDIVSPEICRSNRNTNSSVENSLTNDEIYKDNDNSNDRIENFETEDNVNQNVNSIIDNSLTNEDICKKDEIPNIELENSQNNLVPYENSPVLDQNIYSDIHESPCKDGTRNDMEITSGDIEHTEKNGMCMPIKDIRFSITSEQIKEADPKICNGISGDSLDITGNGISGDSLDITGNGNEEYDEYSHLVPLLNNYSVKNNSFTLFCGNNTSNNSNKLTDAKHNLSDVFDANKDSNVEKIEVSTDYSIIEGCNENEMCPDKANNKVVSDKLYKKENSIGKSLEVTNDESNFSKYSDNENFCIEDDIKLYFDDDASSEGVDTPNVVENNLIDFIENNRSEEINNGVESDIVTSEISINLNNDRPSCDNTDENKNDHENLLHKNQNFNDPNFLKYVELKQDSLMDENPGLTNNELLTYLYKVWAYEQELKTVEMKNDELKESSLVKGLSELIKPKIKKKTRNANSVNKTANKADIIVTDQNSSRNDIASMFKNKMNKVSENEISKVSQLECDNKDTFAPQPASPQETSESVTKSAVATDLKFSDVLENSEDGEKSNQVPENVQCAIMDSPSKNGYNSEFLKFLEVKQDAVLEENPNLTEDDLKSYLYSTWKYEQSLKSDEMKNEDLQQLNLIKGLGPEKASTATKKHKKKVYAINEDSDEDTPILKNKSVVVNDQGDGDSFVLKKKPKGKKLRKKVIKPFYNETDDFSNSENDDDANGSPKSDKSSSKSTANTDAQSDEMFPKPGLEEVEYYFSELTAPKPNLFKGLIKEKVCEICEKAGRLLKCKGPCGDMFHLDCVEKQANLSSNNSFRGRKKKKHRGKTKTLNDSESQSDDKSQETMSIDEQDISIEEEIIPIVANVDDFEATLESKMKEIMENPENLIYETHYNSDDDYDWDASVAVPRDSAEVKATKADCAPDGDFKCNHCQKYETPLCFVCKSTVSPKTKVETRQKCNVAHCHKYYHVDCMEHWPQTQFSSADNAKSKKCGTLEAISCPRHVCHTCVSDDPRGCKTRFSSDKLAKCVRCPAVYHSFTKCLPAGTQILTGSQIICPRHYEHRPGKIPCHVNTRWCFICALGGTLICCEYCPTSFHAECLNIKPPDGGYMCEDCETGRLPLYGEMVWVKLGHYRWWPGLVLHPCDIPPNIMSCKHQPGEFVVRFFGQYDYYWVNRGRVFAFQEGDTGTLSTHKTKIDAAFHQAMEDAQRACQILKEAQANEAESTEKELSLLPPHYIKLKVNKPCGSLVNWKLDTSDANSLTQCECNPDDLDPCGPDSHCLNRMLLTECGPTCRADERCNNRSFEKRRYPKLAPYRTPARGWGLKTLEDIRKGQFVIEYVGELIDEEEFRRRMRRKHEMRDENFYFLTLDKDRMIDAGPKGNLARFMNHCCEPNCETQKWTVLGDVRVGLFAMVDIPANTEVTFNYNLESAGIEKKQCMCGARRCSGYIGAKPKQEERPKLAKRVYKKRKTNSVESPSTSQRGAKLKPIKKPKPKELTEIEKDLLIIKNATNGMSSDSESDRVVATENLDLTEKTLKRKRVDFSADEFSVVAPVSPIAKRPKPESDALSDVL